MRWIILHDRVLRPTELLSDMFGPVLTVWQRPGPEKARNRARTLAPLADLKAAYPHILTYANCPIHANWARIRHDQALSGQKTANMGHRW